MSISYNNDCVESLIMRGRANNKGASSLGMSIFELKFKEIKYF